MGGLWGPCWGLLGVSGAALGPLWAQGWTFVVPGVARGVLRGPLGVFGRSLGCLWGSLGGPWGGFGGHRGTLGGPQGSQGGSWGASGVPFGALFGLVGQRKIIEKPLVFVVFLQYGGSWGGLERELCDLGESGGVLGGLGGALRGLGGASGRLGGRRGGSKGSSGGALGPPVGPWGVRR